MPAARKAGPTPEVEDQEPDPTQSEGPQREQLDWEQLKNAEFVSEIVTGNGDLHGNDGEATEAPEEEDDNPYQESDEALPDDAEEKAIAERNRAQRYRMPRP
jgi:hypothetical protein